MFKVESFQACFHRKSKEIFRYLEWRICLDSPFEDRTWYRLLYVILRHKIHSNWCLISHDENEEKTPMMINTFYEENTHDLRYN